MAPPPTLRPAQPSDADQIAAVKTAAARRAYGASTAPSDLNRWLAHRADPGFIAGRIRATDTDGGLFLTATDAGTHRVVGAGLIRPEHLPDGRARGYLADVYVDPPGQRAGTALVTALLRHADARDWTQVRCFVFAANGDALRFFTAHGFRPTSRQPNQELPGDLVEMTRPRPL